ncbi:hypothetical protein LQZ19_03780 [Treponema primitia]|uniref:hypothetical protein n=1 Tax=Treponema primitia TaxID=88058 RepID=UPI00397F183E
MAKQKAIYEPGELDRVRGNLGSFDPAEAKRLVGLLGGEVGVEKSPTPPPPPKTRHETVDVHVKGKPGSGTGRNQPRRRPEAPLPGDTDIGDEAKQKTPRKPNPADDPTIPIRQSYWERVKMDRLCGSAEFDIKNPIQVLQSMLSLFSRPPDGVSAAFVNKRMNEYYKHIELLVTVTRTLLPRNNILRNERFKRISTSAYGIVDIFRQWNIEKIAGDLARLQANPRGARVADFIGILKIIYKPLFLTEQLDLDSHIKEAYRLLYKILFIENPTEAQNKQQEQIRSALAAFDMIRRDIRFLLYPLLLKLLSNKFLTYNAFFTERRNRFMAFLEVTEENRLTPQDIIKEETITEEMVTGLKENEGDSEKEDEEKDDTKITEEEKEKRVIREAERKALDRGMDTLETLFPKAGWEKMSEFPDFFPYFSDIFDLKKNYVLIPPSDPLQQVVILTRILEELLFGLRYVNFSTITNSDGSVEDIRETMTTIMTDWHFYIDEAFGKEYLPRLAEYCRILDSPAESKTSPYAKRLLNELHWTKRLYFLPYYRFEASAPPPFQKKEVIALYPEIRRLRKHLTGVAAGIEQGIKAGLTDNTHCDGIENPWEPYVFQVPNPVSIRLDTLLGKKKTNASLLFYTLAVTVVLDNLVNNDSSWAYTGEQIGALFRSVNDNGIIPVFGIDEKIDTETLFKQSLKQGGED